MSKKLDVTKITNDLKGRSAHFYGPPTPLVTPQSEKQEEQRVETPVIQATLVTEDLHIQEVNVSKETEKQVSKETSFQGNIETSQQVSKETKKQRNKKLKRYATYLSEDSILAMQKIAFETRRRDYEVFQEAVEKYIKRNTA